jgi:hypothetical protein
MRKLTIAMTLFVSLMQAQPGSDSVYWSNLSEDQKVVLLQGIYTGVARSLQIMSEETNRQEKRDPYWAQPFVLENSIKRLNEFYTQEAESDYKLLLSLMDAFYSNPDNSHIPVMDALHIIMLHESGEQIRANKLLLRKQRERFEGR